MNDDNNVKLKIITNNINYEQFVVTSRKHICAAPNNQLADSIYMCVRTSLPLCCAVRINRKRIAPKHQAGLQAELFHGKLDQIGRLLLCQITNR
jgi:hypothetical protein